MSRYSTLFGFTFNQAYRNFTSKRGNTYIVANIYVNLLEIFDFVELSRVDHWLLQRSLIR